jgi:hypothetical protein
LTLAVPILAAPPVAFNRPASALHLPEDLPEAASMLIAGGVLMAFGLVGRKRKKVSERR